jgi:DNA-binding transcriptional MerR regulator
MKQKPSNLDKATATMCIDKFKNILFQIEMVGKVCDIPVRTLSNWDMKGVLPHQKKNDIEKWNTFNLHDLFLIKIISSLRSKNISMKDIKKFCDWLGAEDRITNEIHKAISGNQYIITDLQNNYSIVSDKNFGDSALGMAKDAMFAFNLRPIIYQLTDELKKIKI